MKTQLIVFFSVLFTTANGQGFVPIHWAYLDTSMGKYLMKQCSRPTPESIYSFFKVTDPQRKLLQVNFKKLYSLKSKDCCRTGEKVKNLSAFTFQYIGVVIEGKRFVYINAAQNTILKAIGVSNWKDNPINICDGGEQAWGVLFSLKDKKFLQLAFNGPPW